MEDTVRNYGHRTWANAAWSDITLALATDFSSPGEITTRKAAGNKSLRYPLTRDLKKLVTKYKNKYVIFHSLPEFQQIIMEYVEDKIVEPND